MCQLQMENQNQEKVLRGWHTTRTGHKKWQDVILRVLKKHEEDEVW